MKKLLTILLIAALALSLAACGDSKEPEETAAPKKSAVSVGVVLPGSAEDDDGQEAKLIEKLLTADDRSCEILYSHESSATELRNVEELIKKGVRVLILRPNNIETASAALQKARDAGAVTICLGLLAEKSASVDYYLTFSEYASGVLQGEALVSAYAERAGIPLYLYVGGEDEASFERFVGAWSVLGPAVASGQFTLANCPALAERTDLIYERDAALLADVRTGVEGSAADRARRDLTANDASLKWNVAVLAPNDKDARAISDVFQQDEEIASAVITGEGAETDSLSYICKGLQYMTCWPSRDELAEAACLMAEDILDGKTPETDTLLNNGSIDVPTRKISPVSVTAANVSAIVDAGYLDAKDIDGYEE